MKLPLDRALSTLVRKPSSSQSGLAPALPTRLASDSPGASGQPGRGLRSSFPTSVPVFKRLPDDLALDLSIGSQFALQQGDVPGGSEGQQVEAEPIGKPNSGMPTPTAQPQGGFH